MADFYQGAVKAAQGLLKEFGTFIVLIRDVPDIHDPRTGEVIVTPDERLVTTGISRLYRKTMIDNTLIKQGDKELILVPDIEPSQNDRIEIDGDEWQIVGIDPVKPADIVLLYFVQIRRIG